MVAALEFFEFLSVFEFEALLVVAAFVGVFVLDADESIVLGREEVPSEVGGGEGVVAVLAMTDLVHCEGLVFVGRVLLVGMVYCHVFSWLVGLGWAVGGGKDVRFSWELEFFGGGLGRAQDEFVLEQLHYLIVGLLQFLL